MKIITIGAGVTGVAFNYFLNQGNNMILEKENVIGGKCRSYRIDTEKGEFTFDFGGHWLHVQMYPEILDLFSDIKQYERQAYIYINRQLVEYPIQSNYHAISDQALVKKIAAELKTSNRKGNKEHSSFKEMLLTNYGPTLYECFFRDYNEKLFNVSDLGLIPCQSTDRSRNVFATNKKGYNDVFYYYCNGKGISQGIEKLAKDMKINLKCEVESILLDEKKVILKDKTELPYDILVNTIPLKELFEKIVSPDQIICKVINTLKCSSGKVFNLGISENASFKNIHWIYYPQKELPFFRIGFYSNVDMHMAPEGCMSVYVECNEHAANYRDVVKGLEKIRLINSEKNIIMKDEINLDIHYCFFNEIIEEAMKWLKKYNLYSIGRYGSWHWTSIHEDIKQAHNLATEMNTLNKLSKEG